MTPNLEMASIFTIVELPCDHKVIGIYKPTGENEPVRRTSYYGLKGAMFVPVSDECPECGYKLSRGAGGNLIANTVQQFADPIAGLVAFSQVFSVAALVAPSSTAPSLAYAWLTTTPACNIPRVRLPGLGYCSCNFVDSPEQAAADRRIHSFDYEVGVYRKFFTTPFDQHSEHVGKPFFVKKKLRDVNPEEEEDDMYLIELEDGTELEAFGHEVCVLNYENCR